MSKYKKIIIGTAGLGLDYGIPRALKKPINVEMAVDFIKSAFERGICTFDTAPTYGDSELKLGIALEDKGDIWTKCGSHRVSSKEITDSLEKSFNNLHRKKIYNVQWHSWSPQISEDHNFLNIWNGIKNDDRVKNVGASTYGTENAIAAVTSGLFDIVQVEWNLLNHKVIDSICEQAKNHGVKIAVRGILLRGLLTSNAKIPPSLKQFEPYIKNVKKCAMNYGLLIEELAIASALSNKNIDFIIIGVSNINHLDTILRTVDSNISIDLDNLKHLDCSHLDVTDPRTW